MTMVDSRARVSGLRSAAVRKLEQATYVTSEWTNGNEFYLLRSHNIFLHCSEEPVVYPVVWTGLL